MHTGPASEVFAKETPFHEKSNVHLQQHVLRHWGKKETIFFVNQEYSVGWGPSKGAITGHEVERRSEKLGPGFDRTTLRSAKADLRHSYSDGTSVAETQFTREPWLGSDPGEREAIGSPLSSRLHDLRTICEEEVPVRSRRRWQVPGANSRWRKVAEAKWKEGDGIMSHVTLIRIWTIRRAQARLGCAIKVTGNDAANWRQAALVRAVGITQY
ncbi:hypothetical protein C8J57DRAFT_1213753 [Mycena rebaudengoi]|nr:hypothetical protein C8J57DRAFT_1213753 [Mycena rebaudengoi]